MTDSIEDKKLQSAERTDPIFTLPNMQKIPSATLNGPNSDIIGLPKSYPTDDSMALRMGTAVMGNVARAAGIYAERRGISNGTLEDGLGITVKLAVDTLDTADGRSDGIIARSTLVGSYKAIEGVKAQAQQLADEPTLYSEMFELKPDPTFSKVDIEMMEAGLLISKLPEHFTISDNAQDQAIRKAVAALDKDHNGRISKDESKSRDTEGVFKQLVKDLAQSAVPATPSQAVEEGTGKLQFWKFNGTLPQNLLQEQLPTLPAEPLHEFRAAPKMPAAPKAPDGTGIDR